MRAAVLREFNVPLHIEEVEVQHPGPDEVMVRIASSGICGSDLHMTHGQSNIKEGLPMVLGHEGAGVVEAVGPGVTDLRAGDRVIIAMGQPCGRCSYCREGRMQYCDGNPSRSIIGEMDDGTFRLSQGDQTVHSFVGIGSLGEYAVVSRRRLVKLETGAPFESMCLISCGVVTGVGAVFNASDVKPGSSVLVFGCGGVGLCVVQAARIAGAGKIIAVDINTAKLDLASNLGASHCIVSPEDPDDLAARVRTIVPRGVDCAFDAVGTRKERLMELMGMTDFGGLTVSVGILPWDETVPVLARDLLMGRRRLTGIAGGNGFPGRDIPRILQLYETGRLKLDQLVGDSFELDEIVSAFASAARADHARTVVRVTPSLL
jgi:S-(hydroxymethyl)glutathione dehydrogenase / alcohol dehydrogenase